MQSWDLTELSVEPRQPEVLTSADEGRAIAIQLPAGEALDEHQVHERAWLVVVGGRIQLSTPAATPSTAAPACSRSGTPPSATRCEPSRTPACC